MPQVKRHTTAPASVAWQKSRSSGDSEWHVRCLALVAMQQLHLAAWSALVLQLVLATAADAQSSAEDAVPAQLSLVAAEQIFLSRGLDLLIAEFGAQGAEGDLRAAAAHPNPNLGVTGN